MAKWSQVYNTAMRNTTMLGLVLFAKQSINCGIVREVGILLTVFPHSKD